MAVEDWITHTVPPFKHQEQYLTENAHKHIFALLWEQGCAKTKPVINNATMLYKRGNIDGLLIIAPPGVQRNWANDQIPLHCDKDVYKKTYTLLFDTKKKANKSFKAKENVLLHQHNGLGILLISYPACLTKEGYSLMQRFLERKKVMFVLDESHYIKTPSAKITKRLVALGKKAIYKRILTGTPISTGAQNLYSQIRFLDENFWKEEFGLFSNIEFKHYFGTFTTQQGVKHFVDKKGKKRVKTWDYEIHTGHKNIDKLTASINKIGSRIVKDEVLDLPPKIFQKEYFELSSEQERLYKEMEDELKATISEDFVIDVDLPVIKLLRLQQIACNYLPTEFEEEPIHKISADNPRLKLLEEICSNLYHPAIIWCRFREDITSICNMLGKEAVRYDGTIDEDEAEKNKNKFTGGEVKYFVSNPQKGGTGLTLTQAKTAIYYSNSFRLLDRLQSEDRCHRPGTTTKVNYIDIIANCGIDNHIVNNLRNKKNVSNQILNDKHKDWI